jgi:FdhE protein
MTEQKTLSPEAIASGEVAKPPFAILPDPAKRFLSQSNRFKAISSGHQMEAYLRFLAAVTEAQHQCQAALPQPALPNAENLNKIYGHGVPPIAISSFVPDDTIDATLVKLLEILKPADMPEAARAALQAILDMDKSARKVLFMNVINADIPPEKIAAHVFAASAIQLHFSGLAAQLDAGRLTPVGVGSCPSCGGSPVASTVVELPRVSGHRYCHCSLCGTQWNVPRVKCLNCGNEKGIVYRHLEGISDSIKAEACDSCTSYVKIFYQTKDPALDPVADDVASLGLDLRVREEGYARASANLFLLGY